MASRLIRNQLLRKELRVRVPCPPLSSKHPQKPRVFEGVFLWHTRVCHECAKRSVLTRQDDWRCAAAGCRVGY